MNCVSLANDYRPKTFEDVTEQSLVVNILKNMCKSETLNHRNFLFIGPAGCGKAQPMYSKVLTPTGYVNMRDVKLLDPVIDGNGKITYVAGVFKQGSRPIYRIHLSDDTYFDVADNHINSIYEYDDATGNEYYSDLETLDLIKLLQSSSNNICIPTPVIDCWSNDLTFLDSYKYANNMSYTCEHIKCEYMYSSLTCRTGLICGLTKNSVDHEHGCAIEVKYRSLAEDIAFVARSLGMVVYIVEDDATHCCSVLISNRNCLRIITSIESIGVQPCQCIFVYSDCHTYITDNVTVTHNTTLCRCVGNMLNHNLGGIIEVDAASYSGVDRIREIVQDAQKYPVGTPYKIFIIDEVHALSNAAFQALLKCLEESPAKSVFMFATTNPEKIPATILSRVQVFQLSKISLSGITNRLKYVLDTEIQNGSDISYTPDAISFIAKMAKGGMRDALTLLDKVLVYDTNITSESVTASLGLGNYDDFFELLGAIGKHDNNGIIRMIDKVYNSGTNFIKWFEEFHSFTINILKYIYMQDISATMIPSQYTAKISGYGAAHAAICQRLSTRLVSLIDELKSTQYQQEIAITYLCAAQQKK